MFWNPDLLLPLPAATFKDATVSNSPLSYSRRQLIALLRMKRVLESPWGHCDMNGLL